MTGLEVSRPPTAADSWTSGEAVGQWPEVDLSDGGVDLRAELAGLLERHGHYVYLRRSTGRHCHCWDDRSKEADPDCPICTGEGWEYEDVKVLARKTFLTDPMTAAFLQKSTPVGHVSVSDQIFWLEHDARPTRIDKIIEVSLDAEGEPVVARRIEMVWEINWVQDYRDKWGRVEFWGCWVHNAGLTK